MSFAASLPGFGALPTERSYAPSPGRLGPYHATFLNPGPQAANSWILPVVASGGNSVTNSAGGSAPYAYLIHCPWTVPTPFWIDALCVEVTTASSAAGAKLRFGIWDVTPDGQVGSSSNFPNGDLGTVAIDSTGMKTATFTPVRVAPPGVIVVGQAEGVSGGDGTQAKWAGLNNFIPFGGGWATAYVASTPPAFNSNNYGAHMNKGTTGYIAPNLKAGTVGLTQNWGISNWVSIWGRVTFVEASS